jgi:phage portal protein BeeE
MVGVGPMPTYDNIEKLNQQYYQQALQELIECIEETLDHGLALPSHIGVQLNIDNLIRMAPATLMETLEKGKNYLKPNEARRRLNLPPVEGGDAVYRQQQDFSLPALAKRDAKADPFAKTGKTPSPPASEPPVTDDEKSTATLLHFRVQAKALASRYEETRVERAG